MIAAHLHQIYISIYSEIGGSKATSFQLVQEHWIGNLNFIIVASSFMLSLSYFKIKRKNSITTIKSISVSHLPQFPIQLWCLICSETNIRMPQFPIQLWTIWNLFITFPCAMGIRLNFFFRFRRHFMKHLFYVLYDQLQIISF